jgi:transposase
VKDVGPWFVFLSPYSPDLNPIEMAFAKLKASFEGRQQDATMRYGGLSAKSVTFLVKRNTITSSTPHDRRPIGRNPR